MSEKHYIQEVNSEEIFINVGKEKIFDSLWAFNADALTNIHFHFQLIL